MDQTNANQIQLSTQIDGWQTSSHKLNCLPPIMMTVKNSPSKLRILQMNLHKSKSAIFDMTNEAGNLKLSDQFDVICIQEPWTDSVGNTRANAG